MKLYHYTDLNALMGIVGSKDTSGSIWMSGIKFMNDLEEFSIGRKEIVDTIVSELDFTKWSSDEVEKLIQLLLDNVEEATYTFSLSTKGDDLSQWRGYCPAGGVCIEFDIEKLQQLIKNDKSKADLIIVECKYRNSKDIIEEIEDFITENMRSLLLGDNFKNAEVFAAAASKTISNSVYQSARVMAKLKNEHFSDECEYRIIANLPGLDEVRFRPGRNCLIPFFELRDNSLKVRDCITKITISPGPDQDRCKKSIDMLMKREGLELPIEKSLIPLVSR